MVGKKVNELAKSSSLDSVRSKAKELVEEWKRIHRKRKSDAVAQPQLRRNVSSTGSIGLGLSQEEGIAASPGGGCGVSPSPSNGPATPLQKMDSTLSLSDPSADADAESSLPAEGAAKEPAKPAPYRAKVRQKLVEALGKSEAIEVIDAKDATDAGSESADSAEQQMRDPAALAAEIEEALAKAFTKEKEYLSQARSVIYNLKDSKNVSFRFKLMVGFFKPEQVPKLSAEEMASDEKNAERAKQRKDSMEEMQLDWALKHGALQITGMFTCGKCKATKTTYFQMQTRSSDEPMTTFVTCLNCNNRWKFC
jgi:transcription elongation factor S-II